MMNIYSWELAHQNMSKQQLETPWVFNPLANVVPNCPLLFQELTCGWYMSIHCPIHHILALGLVVRIFILHMQGQSSHICL